MNMYEQTLHFSDEAFVPVVQDAERVLQRLLKNMVDKGSSDGSLTIKVDVEMVMSVVQNFDPNIEGDTRKVLLPKLSHKVSSVMQIKDESKGSMNTDGYELVWDDDLGEFVLKPVAQAQQTIFDADYTVVKDDGQGDEDPVRQSEAQLPVDGGRAMLPEHSGAEAEPESKPNETAPFPAEQKSPSPFEYLMGFIGEDMRVTEGAGYYSMRTTANRVVLSSGFRPTDRFFCSAKKLRPHVGHRVVCVGYGQERIVNVSIECTDCNEVLSSIDEDEIDGEQAAADYVGKGPEEEDLSDAFEGGYQYEQPHE